MKVKYAIINPTTGLHNFANTEEEIIETAIDNAIQFYMSHTHGAPISTIHIKDDGSEVWFNEGKQLPSKEELEQSHIERMRRNEYMQKDLERNYETIPVTTPGE